MSNDPDREFRLSCPAPRQTYSTVQMAHGGGGRLMRNLIEQMFLPAFGTGGTEEKSVPHDSAVLPLGDARVAFTTDTFVVSPLFFPGGDIGKLAVYGTANDLAMAGARPRWLSVGMILEEGLTMDSLQRIVASMRATASEIGVKIVTGDTKVVDRGKGDGVFINTAGIGVVAEGIDVSPRRVTVGDRILVSGDLGRHGIAIMSVREGLEFQGALDSDCGSLWGLVETMLAADPQAVHCLRDLTRGGLASALNEIAKDMAVGVELNEAAIPIAEPVAGACELLGLDPLYVANEGRLVAFVAPHAADRILDEMRRHPSAPQASIIGTVLDHHPGLVELRGPLGGGRILDLLSGEQMPRIC
ncbi:MAG: hydrogenase expression/formation protein HypE [Rhodopirellula sp.]|nr:hydrogenase expression/formation protein HypE [Rhodopirellula sp.]